MPVPTIACALRVSGQFNAIHVARLYEQVRANTSRKVRFVCFTDRPDHVRRYGIHTETLTHRWPGYWCKIEVLRQPGPCLYLDLDTTIVADLTPLLDAAERHEFVAIAHHRFVGINSSVMAWSGDVSDGYHRFAKQPGRYMWIYRKTDNFPSQPRLYAGYEHHPRSDHGVGDQGFIFKCNQSAIAAWDSLLPGAVLSYKLEWMKGADQSRCRVVYFHGKPRPWDVDEVKNGAAISTV